MGKIKENFSEIYLIFIVTVAIPAMVWVMVDWTLGVSISLLMQVILLVIEIRTRDVSK